MTSCIDVCYEVLKMLIEAGESLDCEIPSRQLCMYSDLSGVNHDELLRRLGNYKLTKTASE